MANLAEALCAVVPAFNEAPYLGAVLEVLTLLEELERITVVDDGSEDGTAEAARRWAERDSRVRLLRLPVNGGKAAAMTAGAEVSPADLVVFLDADLLGLRPEHVRALAGPVAAGRCEMTVGVFRGGRLATDFTQAAAPVLSGQRCLRWSLFRDAPDLCSARGGAEVALSLHARRRGYRVRRVPLPGVTHVMKHEKQAWLPGRAAHARMFCEIFRYLAEHVRRR